MGCPFRAKATGKSSYRCRSTRRTGSSRNRAYFLRIWCRRSCRRLCRSGLSNNVFWNSRSWRLRVVWRRVRRLVSLRQGSRRCRRRRPLCLLLSSLRWRPFLRGYDRARRTLLRRLRSRRNWSWCCLRLLWLLRLNRSSRRMNGSRRDRTRLWLRLSLRRSNTSWSWWRWL